MDDDYDQDGGGRGRAEESSSEDVVPDDMGESDKDNESDESDEDDELEEAFGCLEKRVQLASTT